MSIDIILVCDRCKEYMRVLKFSWHYPEQERLFRRKHKTHKLREVRDMMNGSPDYDFVVFGKDCYDEVGFIRDELLENPKGFKEYKI